MSEKNDEKIIMEMSDGKIVVNEKDYEKLITDAQKFTNDLRFDIEEEQYKKYGRVWL